MYKRSVTSEPGNGLAGSQATAFFENGDFSREMIVISPHPDDAAFSLAGTLKVLVSAGCGVRIINCFTLSRYAPFGARDDRLSVVTRRRHEEELFLHDLGGDCRSDDLGLVDAPARTGGIRGILAQNDSQRAENVRLLVANLEEPGPDTAILAPLAIGKHADHSIARHAALAKYRRYPLAFYEDLPYAAMPSAQILAAVEETLSQLEEKLQPLLVHWLGDSEWKRRCCARYKSQISEAGIQKIVDYMERNNGERLWCSSRFLNWWKRPAANRPAALRLESDFAEPAPGP
ncbi:MAG TPA: PIG-L family deacetylase [Candidatus Angelobacter sp.]|nr:PIG-L family deacetylase [Candidatus Angelobacter sp.]